LNTAIGGFLAGSIIGLRCESTHEGLQSGKLQLTSVTVGSTPAVLGFGALTATVLGAYDYTGGRLNGFKKDAEMDEFERKEYLRKNRRRPIEQTISEIGEGRGMHNLFLRFTPSNS
jgi:hypothetical protein